MHSLLPLIVEFRSVLVVPGLYSAVCSTARGTGAVRSSGGSEILPELQQTGRPTRGQTPDWETKSSLSLAWSVAKLATQSVYIKVYSVCWYNICTYCAGMEIL